MELVRDENKRYGMIATILLHALILLLFLFFGLTEPFPPPEEIGTPMQVMLGMEEFGMGKETPTENPSVSETNIAEVEEPVKSNPEPVAAEKVAVQDVDETVKVNTTEKEEVKKPTEKEIKEEQARRQKEHFDNLFNKVKKNQDTQQGGSKGNGDKAGNQGKPNGGNTNNSTGGPIPGGGSWELSGRAFVSSPKIDDSSQEVGTVVVDIMVDRTGNVIRATPGGKGTTTSSNHLYKKAKEAAIKTKFSPNPDAPEEQVGQMTFVFAVR